MITFAKILIFEAVAELNVLKGQKNYIRLTTNLISAVDKTLIILPTVLSQKAPFFRKLILDF